MKNSSFAQAADLTEWSAQRRKTAAAVVTRASWTLTWIVIGFGMVVGGGCCRDGREWPWACGPQIAPGATPPPIGTYVCAWETAQAETAEGDDGVIYQYEWRDATNELGPFGSRHLAQLAHRLRHQPLAILIEPSESRDTDEARREVVIEYLQNAGVESADTFVRVARGDAEGLYGDEALRLGRNYLLDGSRGGGMGGGGGGMGGGTGGMGGGMGGMGGGIQ